MEDSPSSSASTVKGATHAIEMNARATQGMVTSDAGEVDASSPVDADSPYKRRRVGSHNRQDHSSFPQAPSTGHSTEALSSVASTADLVELEAGINQARGRSVARSGALQWQHLAAPTPAKRWSPSLPPTEYGESDDDWDFSSTPRIGSVTPIDDSMAVADWRIKGRFLEFRVAFKDDAKDTPALWVQGQTMPQDVWKVRIEYYFRTKPEEYKKFRMILGHDSGTGKIESNWSPKVYRVSTPDHQTLTFMTNDGETGESYSKCDGQKLDMDHWKEAVAQHWRERLYTIQQFQVQILMKEHSMRPGAVRSRDKIEDCSRNIVPYDEGRDVVSEAVFEEKMAAGGDA